MGYPTQEGAMNRMEKDTMRARRVTEERACIRIRVLWTRAKAAIKNAVREEYRRGFPGRETWDLGAAKTNGTMDRIKMRTQQIIDAFEIEAGGYMTSVIEKATQERKLRRAWMLDQVTPPGIAPIIDGVTVQAREAAMRSGFRVLTGLAARQDLSMRMGSWLSSYQSLLGTNMALGAMNGSSLEDAADEIDAVRPGRKSNDFLDVMENIFRTTLIASEAMAERGFHDQNKDLIATEIWRAHDDFRVCIRCSLMDGKERGKTMREIPLHPRCRCYWAVVPKKYADFMSTADPEAKRAADLRGIAPNAMFLRDPKTDKIQGYTSVDFFDWKKKLVATY